MKALWYLWRRTKINRFKRALKKVSTYVFLAIIVFYIFFVVSALQDMFVEPTPAIIAATLTGMSFMMIPGSFCTYAKRKGLLFRNCDVHFMLPSPLTPKLILNYAYFQTILTKIIFCVIFAVVGVAMFHVAVWRMLIYMLFSLVLQNAYEGSFAMLMYGSEKMTEKSRWICRICAYGLGVLLLVAAFFTYLKTGWNISFVAEYLNGDYVQFVPVIGWYTAVIHLIFLGPTTVNLIGLVFYLISFAILLYLAVRMECKGEYYEDVLKFADDYEEAVAKQKSGNQFAAIGKKEKFKEASVVWKGTGAKAIFYRELLEYKKTRFGIFNLFMAVNLIASIAIAVLYLMNPEDIVKARDIIALGVGVYIHFLFCSINGKWAKELSSPFTYLLPDNTFRKLWYVTLIPNIQNLIAALLLIVPSGIVMGVPILEMVLMVIGYTVYAASKLYGHAVAEALFGDGGIPVFKQWFEMLVVGFAIGFAALGAVLGFLTGSVMVAYILGVTFVTLYVVILIVISTLNFYHMEKS